LAELMYGDSDALPRFLKSRRKQKNLIAGSARFVWWGVTEPFRALRYAMVGKKGKTAPEINPGESVTPQFGGGSAGKIRGVSGARMREMLDQAAGQLRGAPPQTAVSAEEI
ncbi:hypothetical protein, partial [Rhodoblastus sp.]|uniref:hypothetical protein n=1 Tax=Rhodoblastus sp. TaxID=1962975 RepID=UPI003F99FFB6